MAGSERIFCYPGSVVSERQHPGIGLTAVAVAAAAMRTAPDELGDTHNKHGPRRQTAGNREDKGG